MKECGLKLKSSNRDATRLVKLKGSLQQEVPPESSCSSGHETSTQVCTTEEGSDTMALCGRRNRPKLLFCLFGATLVGYLIFFRHSPGDVSATNRREAPGEREVGNEELKKPVYERPPLDGNALGEMGRPVKLNLNGEEKRKEEESIKKHQINTYVSDRVSLHRKLPERWNPL